MVYQTVKMGIIQKSNPQSELVKVLENNRDGVIIIDKEGIVLFANSATEKLFGIEENKLLGHAFGSPAVSGETTEINIHPKGKNQGYAEITVLEIVWEESPAFLLVIHDITERKKAEQQLKLKNEELERFNKIAIDRELKMIELKKRVKELEAKVLKTK